MTPEELDAQPQYTVIRDALNRVLVGNGRGDWYVLDGAREPSESVLEEGPVLIVARPVAP
jgi:hypothetical protein